MYLLLLLAGRQLQQLRWVLVPPHLRLACCY
jgi:hypothetical protein